MPYSYHGRGIAFPVSFFSDRVEFDTETLSLKRNVHAGSAQRWSLQFTTIGVDDEVGNFLAHTAGYYDTETMVMPQLFEAEKKFTFTGTLATTASANAGVSLVTAEPTPAAGGVIPAGYFVKFDNHDKVYVVTVSRTMNQNRQINLFPRLVKPVPTGTAILTGDDCVITYKRDFSTARGITFQNGRASSPGTITLREHL